MARTPLSRETVGQESCSCPALGQRSGRTLVFIHVLSVLLLAYETVETTAEEKYLIYTLGKALLESDL